MTEISTEGLVPELIDLVIKAVNLNHIDKTTLSKDTSLTKGGLELDSIDILEIVVCVEKEYGVKIRNAEEGKSAFVNFESLAKFISLKKAASA